MIRVLLHGAFHNRQPLAYAPIADRIGDRIALVDAPDQADIVLITHHKDLELFGTGLWRMLAARPALRVVLLSEEPFWDTCWAPDPFSRYLTHRTHAGPIPYLQINHATSRIWDTGAIPYFLLTDPRYIAHLRPRFARNAGRSVADWVAHFRDVETDAFFLGEKRTLPRHAPAFPRRDVWGLSVYRSKFTRVCTGRVVRAGKGWGDDAPRQTLDDWHADKMERIDLRCRYVGAFENTHQANYVSEKIFDAFAAGAVPLYFAAPDHDVWKMTGAGGWLNFHATPPRAPVFDARRPVTTDEAERYSATQVRLATTFTDPAVVSAALDRFADALVAELRSALH